MSTTRRAFVKAGLIATAFAALPVKSILGQSWKQNDGNPGNTPEVQTNPLGDYTKATFQSYLNSIFQLHTINGIVAVTLISVDDLEAPKGGESFALIFRGGSRAEGQDTYTMVHPSLGTLKVTSLRLIAFPWPMPRSIRRPLVLREYSRARPRHPPQRPHLHRLTDHLPQRRGTRQMFNQQPRLFSLRQRGLRVPESRGGSSRISKIRLSISISD